jgi:hypothetical protein
MGLRKQGGTINDPLHDLGKARKGEDHPQLSKPYSNALYGFSFTVR